MNQNLALLAALLLYFVLAFVWPTWRVWRATGRNPYVLPQSDDAYGYVARGMKLLIAALLCYSVGQLLRPDLVSAGAWRAPGWAALAAALLWTLCAQYQMGQSWRIGIDTQHRTALVSSGLFAWSRNPIFLGMRVCLAALVLLQPNACTIAFFVAGEVLMQVQVRLEEAFLHGQHGAAYLAYRGRVRRWL